MPLKVKISKEAESLLEDLGTKVVTKNAGTYIHLPFWFKKIDDELYEVYQFYDLPEDLVEHINDLRG